MELNGEQLQLKYIPLDQVMLWDENPKKHDVGSLMTSIKRYGFVDPPKFDPNLNGGKGGIVYGNGRSKCVMLLKQENPQQPPRGVLVDDKGAWYLPVLFGLDAESEAVATALALDHNNLQMSGEDFDMYDMAKMWDGVAYAKLLGTLHEQKTLPVTMDSSDIEAYLRVVNGHVEGREFDESLANGVTVDATFKIKLPVEEAEAFEPELENLLSQFPKAKMEKII